jgi:hypothetical protein
VSGYVASARIVRASPRLARATATGDPGDWRPAMADQPWIVDAGAVDARGPSLAMTLAERRDALRERWAQLTFFLFDSESWRT